MRSLAPRKELFRDSRHRHRPDPLTLAGAIVAQFSRIAFPIRNVPPWILRKTKIALRPSAFADSANPTSSAPLRPTRNAGYPPLMTHSYVGRTLPVTAPPNLECVLRHLPYPSPKGSDKSPSCEFMSFADLALHLAKFLPTYRFLPRKTRSLTKKHPRETSCHLWIL